MSAAKRKAANDPIDGSSRPASFLRMLVLVGVWLALLIGCAPAGPQPVVSLALLGDVMLGRGVRPSAQSFEYLAPYLASADLALANLESPLTVAPAQSASPYVLCAAPDNVRFLAAAGIDLLSLANNHRLDCGQTGLAETRDALTAAGLGFIGPDVQPVYREIRGVRLAFLAFDATGQLGAFDREAAVQAVRSARASGALVVVSMHWGLEYQSGASPEQQQLAAQLAQAGAALIWGQHPHVLQPAAWIGPNGTLVLYSLGNALFDQMGLANTRQGALVVVSLDATHALALRAIPFLIDSAHSRIVSADAASAQSILNYFAKTKPGK